MRFLLLWLLAALEWQLIKLVSAHVVFVGSALVLREPSSARARLLEEMIELELLY